VSARGEAATTASEAAGYEQMSMLGDPVPVEEVLVEEALEHEPERAVRDAKQMAFSYTGRGASALLRSSFHGERYRTAVAVYCALVDLASDAAARKRGTTAEFRVSRKGVAASAAVNVRTLDRYVKEFEALGLLKVERPRGGRHHHPNLWRLLQVDGDARANGLRGDTGAAPNGLRGDTGAAPNGLRGDTGAAPNGLRGDTGAAPNGLRGDTGAAPVVQEKKELQEGNKVLPFRRPGQAADPYAIEQVVRR